MRWRIRSVVPMGGAIALMIAPAIAQAQPMPHYASIAAGKARMRTGPGRNYPAIWLYQRADLPVRVIGAYKEWRKVEDPDGAQGWMQANLLSDRRTAMVRGTGPVELRDRPAADGHVDWRAAPGVIGRISACDRGWCRFDVGGRGGYVAIDRLWGVDPGQPVP